MFIGLMEIGDGKGDSLWLERCKGILVKSENVLSNTFFYINFEGKEIVLKISDF